LLYWLKRGTNTIEELIGKYNKGGNYVFGDAITAADVFFYPQIYNAKNRFNLDIKPYPNVSRVFDNLAKIKEFQDTAPEKQKDFD
jgi:glutathione S-transferase